VTVPTAQAQPDRRWNNRANLPRVGPEERSQAPGPGRRLTRRGRAKHELNGRDPPSGPSGAVPSPRPSVNSVNPSGVRGKGEAFAASQPSRRVRCKLR
jgi:hypothetical protein